MTDNTLKKRTILVVDDSHINRSMLEKIFSDEFHVELASNGLEALDALHRLSDVSAVVLDILMPELDGYGVLDAMQSDPVLKSIPVVVVTANDDADSQLKALDCGAVDVIIKPFNPKITLHRLRSIILRREADLYAARSTFLEQLLYHSEMDSKTGLLNKQGFCRKTAEYMQSHPGKKYAIVYWDVDRFKVFNDVFGVEAGDAFLAAVGDLCRSRSKFLLTYARWTADHFVMCMEQRVFIESNIAKELIAVVSQLRDDFEFVVRVGVYFVDDTSLDISLMCDRALLALRSIKNNYTMRIAYYDKAMREALIDEQKIISEMVPALEGGQFIIYLQPQYNYSEQSLHGAEALVRWQHPEKGLLMPGSFIPIFEHNGFISRLDEYVWEQACILQRRWLDDGVAIVPISVNVSRRDVYNPHLCDILEGLVQKYNLDHTYLRLEITESSYMDNPTQLINVVAKLRNLGFAVEMDDFGSGYSSLNTLKDVPVDMLKLDMKFIESTDTNAVRSGSILTSVIRMANWLKLPVIAEGVEMKDQAEYLKSVGCFYMQGYYCARPMPVEDYDKLLRTAVLSNPSKNQFDDDIDSTFNFLSTSAQSALLFNNFVSGAFIAEFDGTTLEGIRMNDRFFEVLGTTREVFQTLKLSINERFYSDSWVRFLSAINESIERKDECVCEVCAKPFNPGGEQVWTRLHIRPLSKNVDRYVLFISVDNITKEKTLTIKNAQLSKRLSALLNSVPGGILDLELGHRLAITYFNDTSSDMFGYSRDEYQSLFYANPIEVVHPDDRKAFMDMIGRIRNSDAQDFEITYRHKCAGDRWKWVRLAVHTIQRLKNHIHLSGVQIDIDAQIRSEETAARQAKELEHQKLFRQALYEAIPYGVMLFSRGTDTSNDEPTLLSFNDAVWKIYGYTNRNQYVEAVRNDRFGNIYPDDIHIVRDFFVNAFKLDRDYTSFDHRILRTDGSVRWVQALYQKINYTDGEQLLQIVFNDITERKQEDLLRINDALFNLYDTVFEFNTELNTGFLRFSKERGLIEADGILTLDSFVDTLCQKYVYPDDRSSVKDFMDSVKNVPANSPVSLEYRCIRPDGGMIWISSMLLHISGCTWLSCNRDITDIRDVRAISLENRSLQDELDEQRLELERNRIFIQNVDVVIFSYRPDTDTMILYRKMPDGNLSEECIRYFLDTLMENSSVSAADRERVRNAFTAAIRQPTRQTLDYRAKINSSDYILCRSQMTSVADESGKVYRVIGQVSTVQDEFQCTKSDDIRGAVNVPVGIDLGNEDLAAKFDDNPAYICVLDPDSYEILYCNKLLNNFAGNPPAGVPCYSAFMRRNTVCDFCMLRELDKTGVSFPSMMSRNGKKYIAQAASAVWMGRKVIFVSGTSAASFDTDPKHAHELEYAHELGMYSNALFGLYDEILELDFTNNRATILMTRMRSRFKPESSVNISEAIEKWGLSFMSDADKKIFAEFSSLENIRKSFGSGVNPTHTFTLNFPDGTQSSYTSALLQLDSEHYLCCTKDVTELLKARHFEHDFALLQAHAKEQERYRIVVEQTGTAVFEFNYITRNFSASDAYRKYELSRYSHELLFTDYGNSSLVHADDIGLLRELFAKAHGGARYAQAVIRLKMTDGGFRWTHISLTIFRDESGNPQRFIGTLTDSDSEIRAKLELEHVSARLDHILKSIPTGIAIYEVGELVTPLYISDKACEMFGFSREEYDLRIANHEPVNYMPDAASLPQGGLNSLSSGKTIVIPKIRAGRKDGSYFWLRAFCTGEKKSDGTLLCYAVLADISAEVANERRITWQTERYRILSEYAGAITFDYSPHDDTMYLSVASPDGIKDETIKNYRRALAKYKRVLDESKPGFISALQSACTAPINGTHDFQANYFGVGYRWYRAKYVSLADEYNDVYRIVGRVDDINDIVTAQNALLANVMIDKVSGVQNKDSARNAIDITLAEKPINRFDAILFMDLDDFKHINDTIGHFEADLILHRVGSALTEIFRKEDITARFGGDEFIVYMQSVGSIDNVKQKAHELIGTINAISFGEGEHVGCSVGICGIVGKRFDFEEAFRLADSALYTAKASGKNQFFAATYPSEPGVK